MKKFMVWIALTAAIAGETSFLYAQNPISNKPDRAQIQAPQGTQPLPVIQAAYTNQSAVNFVRTRVAIAPVRNASDFDKAGYQQVKQSTQYLDGLGRLLQTVNRQSASGISPKDIVTPMVYDQYGQETQNFLPYVSQLSNGAFKANPFTEQDRFYKSTYKDAGGGMMYPGEQFFYSQTEEESSPLNRPKNVMAAGNSWVGTARGIKKEYLTNTAEDQVITWNVTNEQLTSGNEAVTNIPSIRSNEDFYQEGTLYKNVTLDEQGNALVTYIDKEGRVILKKVQAGSISKDYSGYDGWLCTYYVYDELNLLRFVIPPKATEWLLAHNRDFLSPDGSSTVVSELCFRYEYDEKQRMTSKKLPGAGWVYMVYDQRDHLILSQDANMRAKQQWNAIIYDVLNRPVTTGIYDCNLSQESLQSILNRYSNDITSIPELLDYVLTPLTVTHVDDYIWINKSYIDTYNGMLDASANAYPENLPSSAEQQKVSTKGLVTGTDIRVLEDPSDPASGKWLSTLNFYDAKGRLIQTRSTNYTGGNDISVYRYDFTGNIICSYLVHDNPQASPEKLRIKTNFDFDNNGRLLNVWKTVNDISDTKTRIVQNIYDELGQLSTKALGQKRRDDGIYDPSAPVEKLDYNYNIRGWLRGINAAYSRPELKGGNAPDRWFGMELNYDWGSTEKSNRQYNGNISLINWRSKGDGVQRAYGYSYDKGNRLLGADFSERTGNSYADNPAIMFDAVMGDGSNPASAYDAAGNIQGMTQWGLLPGGSAPVDKLTYAYHDNSNKLRAVKEDKVTAADNHLGDFTDNNKGDDDYGYDQNGNMITDLNKHLHGSVGTGQAGGGAIIYNHLNLPWKITVRDAEDGRVIKGTITYVYDATGNKLEKRVLENAGAANGWQQKETVTNYLGTCVYSKINNDPAKLQFVLHEEGRIRIKGQGNQAVSSFDYFIKDHLGNTRMVLTDEAETDLYPALSFDGDANALKEQEQMWEDKNSRPLQVGAVRAARPVNFGDNSSNGDFVLSVRKSTGPVGAAKLLKVMAGDRIHTSVEYYYTAANASNAVADGVSSLITSIAGALSASSQVAGVLKEQGGSITQMLQNDTYLATMLNTTSGNNGKSEAPKASLNILFFDEQFRFDKNHSEVIPVAYQPGSKGIIDKRLADAAEVAKNGYVYVYFSNESDEMVYFDNFMLTHERGPLLEETHYYPFGLTMAGISTKAAGTENKIGFNGGNELQNKEFSDGSGLELYDAVHRMYDPQLGRFGQIDEFGEATENLSLYGFSSNNPILRNDPLGLKDTVVNGEHGSTSATLQSVYVTARHTERVLQNTYWDLVNGGVSFDRVQDRGLRNWLYRNDRMQNYLARVHAATREQGLLTLEVASYFIPFGEAVNFGRAGAAMFKLFRLRRGLSASSFLVKEGIEAEMQLASHEVLPSLSKMTPDQVALKDLVKEVTLGARKPLSASDTKIVTELAKEVQYPGFRASVEDMAPLNNHWEGGPHIHLPGVASHVPIIQ